MPCGSVELVRAVEGLADSSAGAASSWRAGGIGRPARTRGLYGLCA